MKDSPALGRFERFRHAREGRGTSFLKPLPLLAAAVLLGIPPVARGAEAVPVLVVTGDGHGHGVGMAQDGAYWMGRSGSTTEQILGHFYPGVGTGKAGGAVRVVVLTDDNADTVLTFPQGGEVRSPREGQQWPGFPVQVPPGGSVRVVHDSEYHVLSGGTVSARAAGPAQIVPLPRPPRPPEPPAPSTTTTMRPSTTTITTPGSTTSTTAASGERSSGNSVWAIPAGNGTIAVPDRSARYRGVVEASAAGGPLRLINELDVEQYLRGMGEVRDPRWPPASLRAQAIVARTYALRAMKASGEICDTQRCQVYLGAQAEYAAMDRAVTDSAGKVLMYRGAFAATVYSANGAGVSASPQEGFGTPDAGYPYLRAAPYETHSPDPWETRIALRDLAARLGYRGQLSDVSVTSSGPSGRPVQVTLEGSAGSRTVGATQLAHAMSLRSTKWTPRVELGEAPPPPPALDAIQAMPDDVSALKAATNARRGHRAAPATTDAQRTTPRWVAWSVLVVVVLAGAAGGLSTRWTKEERT